jgi:hypothetical protein
MNQKKDDIAPKQVNTKGIFFIQATKNSESIIPKL